MCVTYHFFVQILLVCNSYSIPQYCPLQNQSFAELSWSGVQKTSYVQCQTLRQEIHCCAQHYTNITWLERVTQSGVSNWILFQNSSRRFIDIESFGFVNETLVFLDVETSDTHDYRCIVQDVRSGDILNLDIHLYVFDCTDWERPPEIIDPDEREISRRVFLGSHVSLRCMAFFGNSTTVRPDEIVTWYGPGDGSSHHYGNQSSAHIYYTISSQISGNGIESSLHISGVRWSDFGPYRCRAENRYGSSEAVIVLKHKFRPWPTWAIVVACCGGVLLISIVCALLHVEIRLVKHRLWRRINHKPRARSDHYDVTIVYPDTGTDGCSQIGLSLTNELQRRYAVFSIGDIMPGAPISARTEELFNAIAKSAHTLVVFSPDIIHRLSSSLLAPTEPPNESMGPCQSGRQFNEPHEYSNNDQTPLLSNHSAVNTQSHHIADDNTVTSHELSEGNTLTSHELSEGNTVTSHQLSKENTVTSRELSEGNTVTSHELSRAENVSTKEEHDDIKVDLGNHVQPNGSESTTPTHSFVSTEPQEDASVETSPLVSEHMTNNNLDRIEIDVVQGSHCLQKNESLVASGESNTQCAASGTSYNHEARSDWEYLDLVHQIVSEYGQKTSLILNGKIKSSDWSDLQHHCQVVDFDSTFLDAQIASVKSCSTLYYSDTTGCVGCNIKKRRFLYRLEMILPESSINM